MSDVMVQILIYMGATFVLGLAMGWVVWRYGSANAVATLSSEVNFWKQNCEQSRFERDADLRKIELLEHERDNLKKRVASMKKA